MEIKQLLSQAIQKRASDLHLVTGIHPTLRIDGTLFSLTLTCLFLVFGVEIRVDLQLPVKNLIFFSISCLCSLQLFHR